MTRTTIESAIDEWAAILGESGVVVAAMLIIGPLMFEIKYGSSTTNQEANKSSIELQTQLNEVTK